MNKLIAYNITGSTFNWDTHVYDVWNKICGVDIDNWNDSDLNNNKPFKLSGLTTNNNYTDITSILNWSIFGNFVLNDYCATRYEIREIVNDIGWNSLTDHDKNIVIDYYAYTSSTDVINYLINVSAYTINDASQFILNKWHIHHKSLLNSCIQRWYYAKLIPLKYLSFNDSQNFINILESLIFTYTNIGRLGINYGDSIDGIMDYIESTNTYQNNGLIECGFILLNGTWNEFISDLKNVFIYGIYNKHNI